MKYALFFADTARVLIHVVSCMHDRGIRELRCEIEPLLAVSGLTEELRILGKPCGRRQDGCPIKVEV